MKNKKKDKTEEKIAKIFHPLSLPSVLFAVTETRLLKYYDGLEVKNVSP